MLYRQARFEEIPILYEIRKKQLIDEGIAPDVNIDEALIGFFERYMSDGTLVEWVAEEHGKIIATAALYFQEFPPTFTNPNGINIKGYVTNMYTAPEYRGRGIARKLLNFEAVGPPGIDAFLIRIEVTEGIDETSFQQLRHLAALFIRKAGILPVGLRILQVDFLMSHVHVPRCHHRLMLRQLTQVCTEGILPFHSIGQALQFILGIRCIYGNEVEIFELRSNHAAFMVVLLDTQTVGNADRFFFAKYRRSGVSLLLSVVPVLVIARKIHLNLAFLQLGFLQTENICIYFIEEVHEVLPHNGTQTVYIP